MPSRVQIIDRAGEKFLHEDPPNAVSFTVYGVPAPAGSKRAFVVKGRAVVTDASARSRPWKALVSDAALKEVGGRGPLYRGPLALDLIFYFPRPQGHYGTGRNAQTIRDSAPPYPAVKPDTTKLVRAVEDALTGIVWKDDTQVVWQKARKFYGEPARCEVLVNSQ